MQGNSMKNSLCKALAAVALLAAPLGAFAQIEERAAIQAAYDHANLASSKHDVKGACAHYTDDYENISSKGQSSKGAEERSMQIDFLLHTKTYQGTTKITDLKIEKNRAVVQVKEHVDCVTQDPQTRKFIHLVEDDTCSDEWIKTPQGWKLARSRNLNSNITVDGKKAD
ncbi:unnamed protein product [Phaeothamnion confervicola]